MSADRQDVSYDPERHAGGVDAEMLRLESQVAASWSVEAREFLQRGVRDGMNLLELGCGPGFVTRRLRALFPESHIVALDHDSAMLERARSLALPNTDFIYANAEETALQSGDYDVVLSRYLLQHVNDPSLVAREALRLLKPGGCHIVVDIDDELWGLVEPAIPGMRTLYAKATDAQSARGGNRRIGRHLGRILRIAGFTNVTTGTFSYDTDDEPLESFLPQLHPDRLVSNVDAIDLRIEELGALYAAFETFLRAPYPYVLMIGFIAQGFKSQ